MKEFVFEPGDKVTAINAGHKVVHGVVGEKGTFYDGTETRVEVTVTVRGDSYCFHPSLNRVGRRDQALEDLVAAAERVILGSGSGSRGTLTGDLDLAVKTAKGE